MKTFVDLAFQVSNQAVHRFRLVVYFGSLLSEIKKIATYMPITSIFGTVCKYGHVRHTHTTHILRYT